MTIKICYSCKEEKSLEEFYRNRSREDGHSGQCKICANSATKKSYSKDEEKTRLSFHRANLKRNFGITPEQYQELLDKQQGCCAICDKHHSEMKTRLAVDHDHHTGEIRGLLCQYCNYRLVGRHRDGTLLRKIAAYVEQGTGWIVPKKKRNSKKRTSRMGRKKD